jgi:hypothetical protein
MNRKKVTIVSLASALAGLAPTAHASVPTDNLAPQTALNPGPNQALGQPNSFYQVGDDLMSLVTSTGHDGVMVADHYSHSSHASHASHYSGS